MKKIFNLIILALFISSCDIQIEAINYGEDQCDFCMMTIVDPEHAAQVVTNKGRNYKFDASECMIHYIIENNNEDKLAHVLSADLLNPGEQLNAKESFFIISENIPSPMGANLSALASLDIAKEVKEENGGDIYDWNAIKKHFEDGAHDVNSLHAD